MGVAGVIFSHTFLILKIYTTFKGVQMMLKIFFDISTGFKFSKISVECSVHSCSCPCTNSHFWINLKMRRYKDFDLIVYPIHHHFRMTQ